MTSKVNNTSQENKKENAVLKQEKERLALEFVHLEKTHKTGMLSSQEYSTAKKSLEKKQRSIEQKEKQEVAKEKAVEEILGSASILSTSNHRHEKYFMKLDSKPHPTSQPPVSSSLLKETPKTKEIPKLASKDSKKFSDKISDKVSDKKGVKKVEKKIEKEDDPQQPRVEIINIAPSEQPKHAALSPESRSSSVQPSPYPEEYKDIDELVRDDDGHWRFALALLTIFLLILLYVKFTSYGSADDVITVDAYLDPTSSYSKDMYLALQSLIGESGDVLWVDYHLIGATEQAVLVSHAVFCAEKQSRGAEYLSYYFGQEVLVSDVSAAVSTLQSYAAALTLDTAVFDSCLSDSSYSALYADLQHEAEALEVTYTPTLLLNNKKIVGAVGADAVKVVLNQELVKMG